MKDTYTLSGKIVFGYLGDNGLLEEINRHGSKIGIENRWTVQLTETTDGYNYYLHPVFRVTHTAGEKIGTLNANGIDIKCYDNVTVVAKMRDGFLGREAYELISIEKS